jgi:hypothetical protein
MDKNNQTSAVITTQQPSLFDRVISSEPARKGIAGGVAGLLIGLVSELIWPSS